MSVEPKRHLWPKLLAGVVVILLVIGVSLYRHMTWKYPYGMSHCCIKGMGISLHAYAGTDRKTPALAAGHRAGGRWSRHARHDYFRAVILLNAGL
ncbi:MAG: hypothetical protein WCQ21_02275 [Verrucomicrobiota bacterium]|jgi:hypothetical protein